MTANAQTTTAPGYRVINPATGAVVEEFATATDAEIQDALAAAESGYQSWKNVDINERAKIVARVGELFAERADELAAIITEEMGKPLSQSKGEAEFCKDIFDYFATEGPSLAANQEIKAIGGGKAVIERLPVGPLLGIMPWNYPYYQVARFAAPNLMLGNTIVLKHAETCPRSALAIQKIMEDAGVPAGVYNNVFATHEQISTIIADPAYPGRLADRFRACRRDHRRTGRPQPEEGRPGTRRLRPVRHPRLRRHCAGRSDRLGHPHGEHRPGLQLQQAHDRHGRHLR